MIYEAWEDMHVSQVAKCGDPTTIKIDKATGMEASQADRLEQEIGTSLGVPNVASVKELIREQSENRLTLSEQIVISRSYQVPSEICGLTIYKFFRKVFIGHLTFRRRGFLGRVAETSTTVKEYTEDVHHRIITEPNHGECRCDPPKAKAPAGDVLITLGNVSIQTPVYKTPAGFQSWHPNWEFAGDPQSYFSAPGRLNLSASMIPEMYVHLMREPVDEVEATLQVVRLYDEAGEARESGADLLDALRDQATRIEAQIRALEDQMLDQSLNETVFGAETDAMHPSHQVPYEE